MAEDFCEGKTISRALEDRPGGECCQEVWVLGAGMGVGREDSGKKRSHKFDGSDEGRGGDIYFVSQSDAKQRRRKSKRQ